MYRIVEALVEKNPKCVHWKDSLTDDKTPLHYACGHSDSSNIKIVKYLINKGADINAK